MNEQDRIDKAEYNRRMADAVQILKNEHYCGTKDAYEYLKEKGKYFNISYNIGKVLRQENPNAIIPNSSQIEDLEEALISCLFPYFSLKIKGYIDAWDDEYLPDTPITDSLVKWNEENLEKFAKDFYVFLDSNKIEDRFSKSLVFEKLFENYLGKVEEPLREVIAERTYDLEENLDSYEHKRVHEKFNCRQIYKRMTNDRIQNRDEYQRTFISSYLDGLESTYFLVSADHKPFPESFDELIKAENSMLINSDIRYSKKKNEDNKETLEFFTFLNRILRRHKSFVEKMLKEYNNK